MGGKKANKTTHDLSVRHCFVRSRTHHRLLPHSPTEPYALGFILTAWEFQTIEQALICQQEKLFLTFLLLLFFLCLGRNKLCEERNGNIQKINCCSVYAPLGLIHNPGHYENNSG